MVNKNKEAVAYKLQRLLLFVERDKIILLLLQHQLLLI